VGRYSGDAIIVQSEAHVQVMCEFETWFDTVEGMRGLGNWQGSYDDPEPPYTLDAGEAVLRLPDGREGNIVITHHQVGSSGERGSFTGSGDPPIDD
jgi:hypothetical protein